MAAEGSRSAGVSGSGMDSGSEVGASGLSSAMGWRLWPSSSMGSGLDLLGSLAGSAGVGFHGDLLLDGVIELAGHLLELFDAGELVDVLEAEAEEEVLGGLVEDGAADDLLAAGGGDELAGHEGAEGSGRFDAADLGDLGGGDGLLVGDDGQGFKRLERELEGRFEALDEASDGVVIFGLGAEAEASGDFADLEAAIAVGVVGDELVEEGAEVVAELAGGEFLLGLAGFGLGGGGAGELPGVGLGGLGGGGFSSGAGIGWLDFPGLRSELWGTCFGVGLWDACFGGGLGDLVGGEGLGVEGVGVFDGLGGGACFAFFPCYFGAFVFEGEGVLLGGDGFELGLAFLAEQAGELGEGDGLFRCVDDGFDLGFKNSWVQR